MRLLPQPQVPASTLLHVIHVLYSGQSIPLTWGNAVPDRVSTNLRSTGQWNAVECEPQRLEEEGGYGAATGLGEAGPSDGQRDQPR